MNEEERFQAYLMSKDPQGRPVWAPDPDVVVKPPMSERPMMNFIKAFLHIGDRPY
jgi:hypothetical protein